MYFQRGYTLSKRYFSSDNYSIQPYLAFLLSYIRNRIETKFIALTIYIIKLKTIKITSTSKLDSQQLNNIVSTVLHLSSLAILYTTGAMNCVYSNKIKNQNVANIVFQSIHFYISTLQHNLLVKKCVSKYTLKDVADSDHNSCISTPRCTIYTMWKKF